MVQSDDDGSEFHSILKLLELEKKHMPSDSFCSCFRIWVGRVDVIPHNDSSLSQSELIDKDIHSLICVAIDQDCFFFSYSCLSS